MVTTQEDKHRILLEHFEGVLGQARTRSTSLDLAAFHHAGIDLSVLDVPFSEDEVWATIKVVGRRVRMVSLAVSTNLAGRLLKLI